MKLVLKTAEKEKQANIVTLQICETVSFLFTQVISFFANEPKGSGERALQQSMESISANIKWMDNNQPIVSQWIQRYVDRREGSNMKLAYYDEIMMMEKYGRP